MNYAFIDYQKKPSIIKLKPAVFTFETGNNLYIFPGHCGKKRLNRSLSRYTYSFFSGDCNYDLKIKTWYKTIIQTMKEYGFSEIVFCSENYMSIKNLLNCFLKNNLIFSIVSSGDCDEVSEYFLNQYGLPVRIMSYPRSSLIVYIDGIIPNIENTILDLTGTLNCEKITICEYFIKNTPFPIAINSLPVLEGALTLTGKELEDIIIKLCIIGTKCE